MKQRAALLRQAGTLKYTRLLPLAHSLSTLLEKVNLKTCNMLSSLEEEMVEREITALAAVAAAAQGGFFKEH
tara:strand:+ start:240 stop:455 length:216 start_codon:yes stop_codon:yes gene_type:complete